MNIQNITIGQYMPGDSCVHRLDPRNKLLLTLVYIVGIFLVKAYPMFLLAALLVLFCAWLAKIPIPYLARGLKPLRFLLIFTLLLQLLMSGGEDTLFQFGFIRTTWSGFHRAIFFSVRLILLVLGTSVLTLTTSPITLTDGLERLLSPLRAIRFPAHEMAMIMTIALRYIPTLLEETDKIMKAQSARGADFETGNLLNRAKAMVPLLVPLFISAFRRAADLAMAMEARCYHGGEGRTRMRVLRFGAMDYVAAAVMLCFVALIALGGILA